MNHYKFTGQERDAETGLDYFNARHYTSQYGRFLQPDPAGLAAVDPSNPQTWNRYAYVMNNPLAFVDPSGMDWEADFYYEGARAGSFTTLTLQQLQYVMSLEGDYTLGPATSGYGDIYLAGFGQVGDYYHIPGEGDNQEPCSDWGGCTTTGGGGNPSGGGGGGGAGGSQPPPQTQTPGPQAKQIYQQCMASFQNSTAGKVVDFGSVFKFADNFWPTLKNWAEVIATKGTYFWIAKQAGKSLSGGETGVTVVSKVLGEAGLAGVTYTTMVDGAVRGGCSAASLGPLGVQGWAMGTN